MMFLKRIYDNFFKKVSSTPSDVIINDNTYKEFFYRSFFSNCLIDKNYKVLDFNKRAEDAFREQFKKEIKIGDDFLQFIGQEDIETFRQNIKRCLLGEKLDFERSIKLTNGSGFQWFHVIYLPLFNDTGIIDCVSFNINEITYRKEKEFELLHAKVAAEDMAKAKQQFLANLSHEIRTPLNGIIGLSNILLTRDPKNDQIPLLNTLKFSSEQLLGLLNEVLDFSKIEAGKIELSENPINLKRLINNLKESFVIRALEKNIGITEVFPTGLPEQLLGDELKLSQVLTNLLSNALKFTDKGSITVEVKIINEDNFTVDVMILVKDTGIGIAENKLEEIFESYHQADIDISSKYGGTGLGLTISKKLLELMNSRIYVVSKLGDGASFYFTVKLKKTFKAKPVVQAIFKTDRKDLDKMNLLLVEDNEVSRFVAEELLKDWRITPDVAENGLIALEMVKEKKYDLILMDVQMPVMDGFEATRAIRNLDLPYYKKVPIIALTADVEDDIKEKSVIAGMNDFITKPFNHSDLYDKIIIIADKINESERLFVTHTEMMDNKSDIYGIMLKICNDNKEHIKELQNRLIRYMEKLPLEFEEAMKDKDPIMLKTVRHTFKPTALHFNFIIIKELLQNADTIIKDPKVNQKIIQNEIDKVKKCCTDVINEVMLNYN